jgi:hypothetical protein
MSILEQTLNRLIGRDWGLPPESITLEFTRNYRSEPWEELARREFIIESLRADQFWKKFESNQNQPKLR